MTALAFEEIKRRKKFDYRTAKPLELISRTKVFIGEPHYLLTVIRRLPIWSNSGLETRGVDSD